MKNKMLYLTKEVEVIRETTNVALSHNGGDYSFWVTHYYDSNGVEVAAVHSTSADISYCRVCGTFSSCYCEEPAIFAEIDAANELYAFATESSYYKRTHNNGYWRTCLEGAANSPYRIKLHAGDHPKAWPVS